MPEIECDKKHSNVEDAIACARKNLGLTRDNEHPWIGTKENKLLNKALIIGCSNSTGKLRWRIDWDPNKKTHVNEENVSEKGDPKKVCHRVPGLLSEDWKWLWWRKLTTAGRAGYDNPEVLGYGEKIWPEGESPKK